MPLPSPFLRFSPPRNSRDAVRFVLLGLVAVTSQATLGCRLGFVVESNPVRLLARTTAPLDLVLRATRAMLHLFPCVTRTRLWIPDWGQMCHLVVVIVTVVVVGTFRLVHRVSEQVVAVLGFAQRTAGWRYFPVGCQMEPRDVTVVRAVKKTNSQFTNRRLTGEFCRSRALRVRRKAMAKMIRVAVGAVAVM